MSKEYWVEKRGDDYYWIAELDGWSYLSAVKRGSEEIRTERKMDLNDSHDLDRIARHKARCVK